MSNYHSRPNGREGFFSNINYDQFFAFVILTIWLLFYLEFTFFDFKIFHKLGLGGYIPCLFHRLTGIECPGCGMTRAFVSLSHFQFYTSFTNNPFGVGLYLYLMILISPFRKIITNFFSRYKFEFIALCLILLWWFFYRLWGHLF